MKIFDEMAALYEAIELGCQAWDESSQPRFYGFELAQVRSENGTLRFHVASWMNLAEHTAIAGQILYLEDGPDILDPEQSKDQGEVLENICAPGCSSLDQALLTEGQAEEPRRRDKAPS
jgi:hypothetical protein